MNGLLNVAREEFFDHITSKKFLIILGLFLIISMMAMSEGIEKYNDRLENYNERLTHVKESGMPSARFMPEKPSILPVFRAMSSQLPLLGAILALSLGFDLITRERESGSLKSLLAHPIFRDGIINGKALGGIAALALAIFIALLISFAMLLIFSIVPTADELGRILLFGAIAVLFLLSFFSIALMASTVSENSGKSFLYAFLIFLILSIFMPVFGGMVTDRVIGEPPGFNSGHLASESVQLGAEERRDYDQARSAYWEKRHAVDDVINLVTPVNSYNKIISEVLPYASSSGTTSLSLKEGLGKIWANILALLIFPTVFFAIAYVKFMREDVR